MSDPTTTPSLYQRQLERWPIAQERALAKAAGFRNEAATATVNALLKAARKAPTLSKRVLWMHKAAAAWSNSIAEVSACKKGCAYCCYIPLTITRTEAQLLSRATGRRIAANMETVVQHDVTDHDSLQAAIAKVTKSEVGVPCPFLVEEVCSVYEHRPQACRTLANIDDDNLLCQHSPEGTSQIPYANNWALTLAGLKLQPGFELADIRHYFPPAG